MVEISSVKITLNFMVVLQGKKTLYFALLSQKE